MADHRANYFIGAAVTQASIKADHYGADARSQTIGDRGNTAQESSEAPSYYVMRNVADGPPYRLPSKMVKAVFLHNYGEENLFYRIWVSPQLIEMGFITEDDQFEIKIWNAYLDREVDFTGVAVVDQEGTLLTYPSLPWTITRSDSLTLDLDVYKEGPPVQNTYYSLTIDGEVFVTNITGTRIIPIEPDIQWNGNHVMTYEFMTVMYQDGVRFKEQRRPLYDVPDRRLAVTYQLEGTSAHRLFNLFSYGHDKVFGTPIYYEKMVPATITVGSPVITLVTDTTDMYNLNNNAVFIIIVDHENEIAEIKEIDTIATNQIDVVKNIVETFDVDATFVYPVFLSILHAVSFSDDSDNVETMEAEFREYIA